MKSRRAERLPTGMVEAPARSASTIRLASAGTANWGVWAGPMWLKGRTVMTCWPWPRNAWATSASAASLLAA